MIEVTRKLSFDAGHRVLGHEGKCKHLHGHTYVAEVTVRAPELDELGRVIDFGMIKTRVGGWVDSNWDHNLILNPQDPLLDAVNTQLQGHWRDKVFGGTLPFIMPGGNPTAENMAKVLAGVADTLLPDALTVVRVRMWETPNCYADYLPDPDNSGKEG